MANTLAGRPGRGGITINERGDQRTIGFWPEQFDAASAESWVGRLRRDFGEAVRIAQRHHTRNEEVRIAKLAGKVPLLPEPPVRQSLARAEQKKLADLHHRVSKVADEAFVKRAALRPFDFDAGGVVGAMCRQELRAALRAMEPDARAAAMRSHRYREAALEQPAELSGIPTSLHDRLLEEEIAAKFPDEVAGTAEAFEAAEIARAAIKTASAAVESELLASGTTVAEPAAAPDAPKAWA